MPNCTLCEKRDRLGDSALGLCPRCAEMIFEQLVQEAMNTERQNELDKQEEVQRG